MSDTTWHCPLYKKDIPEGLCLDINFERLGYFNSNILIEVMNDTGTQKHEINLTCEKCPNQPLRRPDNLQVDGKSTDLQ